MSQYQKKHTFSAIGPNLRALRGSLSQAEFAKFLGVANQVTYHRYEKGRVPKADVLQQIAKRIGITVDDLLSPVSQALIEQFQKQEGPLLPKTAPDWKKDFLGPMYHAMGELVNDESVKQLQSAFGLRQASDESLLTLYEHVTKIESRAPFEIIKYYNLIVTAVQREFKRRLKLKA